MPQPLPAQPISKSNASPGLLAHIATAKYCDALPLARQEQILSRAGIEPPRATTARWIIQLAELITPVVERLSACLLARDILHVDETRIQVNMEADRDQARRDSTR